MQILWSCKKRFKGAFNFNILIDDELRSSPIKNHIVIFNKQFE